MSDLDYFWTLLETAKAKAGDGPLADGLEAELARLPIPRIAEFHRTLMVLRSGQGAVEEA